MNHPVASQLQQQEVDRQAENMPLLCHEFPLLCHEFQHIIDAFKYQSKSMLDNYDPNKDLDAMLHAVELPAGIAHLDSSLEDRSSNISNSDSIKWIIFNYLSNMYGDAFPHLVKGR